MALIGVYADWEGLDGPARIGYLDSTSVLQKA